MKIIYAILGLVLFFAALYFIDQHNKKNIHPTLNSTAELPDKYLLEVVVTHQRKDKEMSLKMIEKAIETLWDIEKDVNYSGAAKIENEIIILEKLHDDVIRDLAVTSETKATYRHVITALGYLEIQVAKNNSEPSKAKKALKYAIKHFQNAQLFLDEGNEKAALENICLTLTELLETKDANHLSRAIDSLSIMEESMIKNTKENILHNLELLSQTDSDPN